MTRDANGDLFQLRLAELFSKSSERLTNKVVVEGLREHGCRISVPYLCQLRAGVRSNPSEAVITALANYFRVPQGYFIEPCREDHVQTRQEDTELLRHVFDSSLKRLLIQASDLSAECVELLVDLATRLEVSDRRANSRAAIPPCSRRAARRTS